MPGRASACGARVEGPAGSGQARRRRRLWSLGVTEAVAAAIAARRLRAVRPPARGPFCKLGARSAPAPPGRPWQPWRRGWGQAPDARLPRALDPCVRYLGSVSSACLWSPVTSPGLWCSLDSLFPKHLGEKGSGGSQQVGRGGEAAGLGTARRARCLAPISRPRTLQTVFRD